MSSEPWSGEFKFTTSGKRVRFDKCIVSRTLNTEQLNQLLTQIQPEFVSLKQLERNPSLIEDPAEENPIQMAQETPTTKCARKSGRSSVSSTDKQVMKQIEKYLLNYKTLRANGMCKWMRRISENREEHPWLLESVCFPCSLLQLM